MKWKRNKLLAWLVTQRWLSFSPSNCILFWMTRNDCMWRGNGLMYWNANWFVVLFCREWVFGEPLQSSAVHNLQWSLAIQQPSITKWVHRMRTINWPFAKPLPLNDCPIVALATMSRHGGFRISSFRFLHMPRGCNKIGAILVWRVVLFENTSKYRKFSFQPVKLGGK